MITNENFFEVLLLRIPEFKSIYDEHVKDNRELLNHVLMGDFTRFVISAFRSTREPTVTVTEQTTLFRRCLGFLEEAMTSEDPSVRNLVRVSFLENLHQAGGDFEAIRGFLGPKLKEPMGW
jgi:hypothetical protein